MKAHLSIIIMALFLVNIEDKNGVNHFSKSIDAPAMYYSIINQDSVLFKYAHGFQSIEENRPIDEHAQFALFSITKTFTTIAILQLQEKGKLRLDDFVRQYLPQYSFLNDITIRHLLSHQSGLNNPLPIKWIHLEAEDPAFNYQKFSSEILESSSKIKNKPGRKSAYSNLNFLLLGEVIEKVTGQDYKTYVRDNILKGNKEIDFTWSSENAVTGYHRAGFSGMILGLLIDRDKYTMPKQGKLIPFKRVYLNGSAYGGLNASPAGLTQFIQELLDPHSKLLTEQSRQEMYAEQSLINGKPSGHSLGWFTGVLNHHKYIHHAGGGGGFYAELRIYPEMGVATFVLTNKSGFSDKRILDQLDGRYLGT